MSKAIQGIAALGAAVGLGAVAFLDPAIVASPLFDKVLEDLVVTGISLEAGAIANALAANRAAGITTRQPAAYRQTTYGMYRVGGVLVYESTTGSGPSTYNQVITVAGHEIDAYVNLYLDGRVVFWQPGSFANATTDGFNFGGWSDANDHVGPDGTHYNFGSNVFVSAWFGDQALGTVDGNLTANDPNWATGANGSPSLCGCSYIYFHSRYDSTQFPQNPEVRITIQGKKVYDPRTGTTAYSNNAALVIADYLMNSEFKVPMSAINLDAWIAAANICDEQVALASGNAEARYAINCTFDSSSDPGDILQAMLSACAGRIAKIGGEWFFWVGAWVGPSLTFDENDLTDSVSWDPYRSRRDLFNHASGTYTAPNYPYNVNVGGDSIYDNNGFAPDGSRQDNFELAYQKTSAPSYAQDTLHGYSVDQFTTADGGAELWKDFDLKFVTSITQAQRLLKIYLMRNRQQGNGKLPFKAYAWQCQPNDVISMTFSPLGWTSKTLEVAGVHMQYSPGDDETAPTLTCPLDVQETDPSVYSWSTTEELTILDAPAGLTGIPTIPAAPSALTLNSGASTAVVGADGVTTPRIEVGWTAPLDAWVTQIQVQYKLHSSSVWTDAGLADVGNFSAFITGVVSGDVYDVRIRSVRPNGAASVWLEQDSYTVSTTLSTITSSGLNPASPYNINNDATIDSVVDGSTADIRIYGPGGVGTAWDNYTGQGNTTYPAATLTGFAFSTGYTVIYDLGTSSYAAYTNFNDTLSDSYLTVGSVLTVSSGGTGGGSGGGGGGTGGGPRAPGCTVEGTMLDGEDGPIDNRMVWSLVHAGQPIYLMGRDVPERVESAEWIDVDQVERISVGGVMFEASDSHTLKTESGYRWTVDVPSGSSVETRSGFREMTRETIRKKTRVLRVHLNGPSHEYSVSGVFSHNFKIAPVG